MAKERIKQEAFSVEYNSPILDGDKYFNWQNLSVQLSEIDVTPLFDALLAYDHVVILAKSTSKIEKSS